MSKKKKENKNVLINLTGDYLVQKHRLLLKANMSSLTLNGLKLFDMYLSSINSYHSEVKEVTFKRGEVEACFGVQRIRKEVLDRITDELLQQMIVIQDLSKRNHSKKINLFSVAEQQQDSSGNWIVALKCTEDAAPYIFNIETIGYVKYRRRLIEKITGMYEYALFLYLLSNKFRREWTVSIDELVEALWVDKPYLMAFKRFNQNVLGPAIQALDEHGIMKVEYTPVKDWKTVTGVRFKVVTPDEVLNAKIPEDVRMESDWIEERYRGETSTL